MYKGRGVAPIHPHDLSQANETIVGVQSAPSYLDQGTINCQTYGYKVTSVDTCGLESAPTSHADGRATSTTAPQAPTGVEAFTLTATRVRVTWQPVMRDVNDASIRIDTYRIYRSRVVGEDEIPPVPETAHATVTGATTYIDEAAPTMGPEQRIYYWVTAKSQIYMRVAYAKNVHEDLTADQLQMLRALVKQEFG